MADKEVETAITVDELLGNGCEDVETLLQACKEQVIELKKLKDGKLQEEFEKDKLSYGSLAAFLCELEAVIYNTENLIEKLESSHKILINSKTMYSVAAAKHLEPSEDQKPGG